jgi:hypothetical protein
MKLGQKKLIFGLVCLLWLTLSVGGALAANLVVNGDFEAGNNSFGSDYAYSPGNMYPQSVYTVAGNPHAVHGSWTDFGPYQGALMMIVNGSDSAIDRVWFQDNVAVVQNTTYYFSTWVVSSFAESPAQLDFSINGASIGSLTASTTTGKWDLFYATWDSGSSAVANLALVNTNTAYSGNDFCLDNITMDTVVPTPLPSSLLLLGSSLAGLGFVGFRKKA